MTVASEFSRKRPLSFERVMQMRREREARGLVKQEMPTPKTMWQSLREADETRARMKRVEEIAALKHRMIDMRGALRRAFPQERGEQKPSVITIQHAVAAEFGITRDDIIGPSRKAHIILPRHIAMWIGREMTELSLPEIGRRFGGRDHSTALAAIRRANERMQRDADLAERVNVLLERVAHG